MGRPKQRPIDILTPQEIQTLVDGCNLRYNSGKSLAAAISLLFATGLRISELLDLMPKDLFLDGEIPHVKVQNGKGDKRREPDAMRSCKANMHIWMKARKEMGFGDSEHVFCTRKGTRGNRKHYGRALTRIAQSVGLGHKRVTPHSIRHSHACYLRDNGLDLLNIQRQLGHATLAITEVYLKHMGYSDSDGSIARLTGS